MIEDSIDRIKISLTDAVSIIRILKRDYREFTSTAGQLEYVTGATYKNVYKKAIKTLENKKIELKQELRDVEIDLSKLEKRYENKHKTDLYFRKKNDMESKMDELGGKLYSVDTSPCDFVKLGNGIDWMTYGPINMYTPYSLERKLIEQKKVVKNKLKSSLEIFEENCSEYENTVSKAELGSEKKAYIESIYAGLMMQIKDTVLSDEELRAFMGKTLRRIKKELAKEMTMVTVKRQ